MTRVVYKSNKSTIGDGLRITRVSQGGQVLEVLTDAKAGTYSEVILLPDAITPPPVDLPPPPVDIPPPPPVEPPASGTITPATFAAALAAATGGETLRLAPGNYGGLSSAAKFARPVTITSADPANPAQFAALVLTGAGNITFQGVAFKYTFNPVHANAYRAFRVEGCTDIVVDRCKITGDKDPATGLPHADGFGVRASTRVTIKDSEFSVFRSCIHVSALSADIAILRNDIHAMRSDGILIIATKGVLIEGNHIHDFDGQVVAGSDHRDMIQFWTTGAPSASSDVVIRNNILDIGGGAYSQSIFMRNEEVDTGRQPGLVYRNILIEGNTIRNCQAHGITVGATDGLTVRNNSLAYTDNAHAATVAHIVKWGATSGHLVPKVNAFAGAIIEGNTFDGAPWFTGPRVT